MNNALSRTVSFLNTIFTPTESRRLMDLYRQGQQRNAGRAASLVACIRVRQQYQLSIEINYARDTLSIYRLVPGQDTQKRTLDYIGRVVAMIFAPVAPGSAGVS